MKRTTRGVRSVPPFPSLPSLLFPLFSTVSRVRTKYLHVNVGHVSRAIPCFAATWTDTSRERIQRSVIENGTRETEPGPALLRFVRSYVRVDRIYEPDRVLTVESNSRAKRIGILFKRPARSPLSYPRIDRIFVVYFLSPCLPFFRVAHRIPYRLRAINRHGQHRANHSQSRALFPPIISISSLGFFFFFSHFVSI